MNQQLVQIGDIPPLRQSTQETLSCPRFYVEVFIKGNQPPSGMDSARGTEVHRTMAAYLKHCAVRQVSTDLEAFDNFSRGAGPIAARMLAGLRDRFEVDHNHFFASELTLALDENFDPTHLAPEMETLVPDSGLRPRFSGTLDGIFLFPDVGEIKIIDFKTHPKPFNPEDKQQAKEYVALVLKHFPWAIKVTFTLVFVRYSGVTREAVYTREQLPALIASLAAARDRQIKIHADYEAGREIEALAGSHCCYCPLLSNAKCPIAKYNPQAQLSVEQRLNFALWYGQFSRANNAALKAYTQETGRPVMLKDFNGKAYVYGPVEREMEVYPVFRVTSDNQVELRAPGMPNLPIVDLLFDYSQDPENGGDIAWMRNVMIATTSLRKYLKTNKRAFLDQAIEDTADKLTKVRLQVSKPLDAVPEEDEDWDEDEGFDEEGEF